LLVLPIVPLAMLLTFLAGLAGWLLPGVALVFGWPAQKLLEYIIWVAGKVAELPGASQTVAPSWWPIAACFLAILAAMLYMWHKTKHNFRGDNPIA
jgi:competence protein ComEC